GACEAVILPPAPTVSDRWDRLLMRGEPAEGLRGFDFMNMHRPDTTPPSVREAPHDHSASLGGEPAQAAEIRLRAGPVRLRASARLTPSGLWAIGGLVSSIL